MAKRIDGYHTLKQRTMEWAFTKDFKKTRIVPDRVFYGIEVEMSFSDSYRRADSFDAEPEIESTFVFEQDGSVNSGFEMITRPFTANGLLQFFDQPSIKDLVESSIPTSGNGIHIHMSRPTNRDESAILMRKLTMFVFRMQERLKELTRNSNYARFYDFRNLNLSNMYLLLRNLPCYGSGDSYRYLKNDTTPHYFLQTIGDRYNCINYQNDYTIEFRFFPTTNNVEKIKEYISFIDDLRTFLDANTLEYITLAELKIDNHFKLTHRDINADLRLGSFTLDVGKTAKSLLKAKANKFTPLALTTDSESRIANAYMLGGWLKEENVVDIAKGDFVIIDTALANAIHKRDFKDWVYKVVALDEIDVNGEKLKVMRVKILKENLAGTETSASIALPLTAFVTKVTRETFGWTEEVILASPSVLTETV